MKRLAFAIVSALALCVGPAFAADMAVKAPPVAAPVVSSWDGFYIGIYGGGVFGRVRTARNDTTQIITTDPGGGVFGGLIGFNRQINSWVLGLEADAGWSGASATTAYISATSGLAETEKDTSTYSAHVRGRIGVPFGSVLPFIAGGASFTNDNMTLRHTAGVLPPGTIGQDFVGWNVGGGFDYAFTQHWIGRIEYIFDQYGERTFGFNAATAGQFSDRRPSVSQNTVRGAISYRF